MNKHDTLRLQGEQQQTTRKFSPWNLAHNQQGHLLLVVVTIWNEFFFCRLKIIDSVPSHMIEKASKQN